YEHVIGNVENLAQRINGSCWINYYARYASMTLDQVQRAIQMNASLLMHRNPIRPSFTEFWNKLVGIFDHQVTVERQFSSFAQRSNDRRANSKIRHEVTVHDIDVDHRTAALGCAADLLRKAGEVRRQNRRC